ncbi:MAG: hypothetical protein AAF389_06005 [Gemmatimonadota bacterium]
MSSGPGGRRVARAGRHFKQLVGVAVLATAFVGLEPEDGVAQRPNESWKTITTEHFRVTYPEHLEELGRRAADRSERAWDELVEVFVEPPQDKIDVLLTDHTDVSNGFAGVTPSNRVVIYARPPVDSWSIGHSDEWLELVITHELVHILHLDLSLNPIGRVARSVFGRVSAEWPFFPELGTPRWVIEGLATWYETELTNAGRVHGTFNEMQIRTAILEDRFEDIGQASGRSPQWPTGNRAYAYGSHFFNYLTRKYGSERMGAFAEAIARQWIPYRIDGAGRSAFGVSLTDEWELWRADLERDLAELDERLLQLGPITESEMLPGGGRLAIHPEVSPDGRYVAFASSDGNADLQIRLYDVTTGLLHSAGRSNGTPTMAWLPGNRLLIGQLELDGPYQSWSDLYVRELDGSERRVTHGARVSQPAPSPDGSAAVAVQQGGGTNALVRVDLATGEVTPWVAADPDVHWAFPTWSPDGRTVAVTRWEPEGYHDLVLLDAGTGEVVQRVTRDRSLDMNASWTADGAWLLWGSDRTGIVNVLGAPVLEDGRVGDPVMLTNVRTGAAYPAVDPSGARLYFSGYHADGWFIEETAFEPSGRRSAPRAGIRFDAGGPVPQRGSTTEASSDYSPWPTVGPKYWEVATTDVVSVPRVQVDSLVLPGRELLGVGVGIRTGGRDLVGRHAWGAAATFAPAGDKFSGSASYSYGGLGNPLLSLSARQGWVGAGQTVTDMAADTVLVLERERGVSAGLTVLMPTWRRNLSLTLAAGMVWESREVWDTALQPTDAFTLSRPTARVDEVSASVSFNSTRGFPFQMGMSKGLSVFVFGRIANDATLADSLASVAGVDRSLSEARGRVRGAIPLWRSGFGRQVLAIQVAGGVANGPGAGIGHFRVGGASGQREQLTGLEAFGGNFIFFPVRGYAPTSRFGRYAWSGSVEWRIPLWLGNQGFRVWPVHLDRSHVSVFFDAGNAWGPDVSPSGFVNTLQVALASAGAELTTEVLALFDVQLRLRGGFGVPFVRVAGDGTSVRGWLRVGVPF